MFDCRDKAVLIDGPVGTGKTMGVLYKGLIFADRYKGARILLVRKTRKSLTESVLVTLEEKILGQNTAIKMHGGTRDHRSFYEFPNGSVMVCGGMDPGSSGVNSRASVMSTEWDLILAFEATEFTEDEIQKLQTRLFRNNKGPYSQIIMDCNPGPPTHFLIRGAHEGAWTRCPSRHVDNPLFWDEDKLTWTPVGLNYMAVLDTMTGHRRARLRDGLWAASEGSVYPEFNAVVHVIDQFSIPPSWRRFRCIDFGYTNPFVCQWWAVDGDGRLFLYREIYRARRVVSDPIKGDGHAQHINRLSEGEKYETTIADHDAEDRATLAKAGIDTTPAHKDVSPGLQAVANRLRPAGDGRPRLFIMRDALVERDQVLSEAKKPCCTAEEWDGYVWQKAPDGRPIKEEPVKVDDHGMDTTRYMVAHLDLQAGFVANWGPDTQPVVSESKTPQQVVDYYAQARQDPDFGFDE